MIYCYICKKEFKHMNAFLTHHRWHHGGMTTRQYYDKYLKKPEEGKCQTPACDNDCNFAGIKIGYWKHCSKKCAQRDPEVLKKHKKGTFNHKKYRETCMRRYGVPNISSIPEVQKKKEKTSLRNNGYKYFVGTNEHKKYMVDGGAAHCNKFIKNPSKPQVKLFELCQATLPYPILNYSSGHYSIDIAIPQLNLAIEYDGSYWHSDKEYDKHRQQHLEEDGWTFIRYIDEVPNKEQLINKIKEILNERIS